MLTRWLCNGNNIIIPVNDWEQKLANSIGALIIDLQGKTLAPDERDLLAHPLVGGVILFTRNYENRAQLTALCQAIRAARPQPLLIMADQEGGRVQRFIPEFTRLPAMGIFGKLHHDQPEKARQLIKTCGWLMAAELLTAGIDMSLAPVLDINKGISGVIGDRAIHKDKNIVIELGAAFIDGLREAGMAATGKHFPGHGSVTLDSHVAMPVDERPLAAVMADDIVPFAALAKQGLSAVMAAHLIFPAIDDRPVGFSPVWLQDILRQQLGFTGAILSDDLNMEGANISANYADRVTAAREAGCDFALLCNQREGVIQAIDKLAHQQHQVSEATWRHLRGNPARLQVKLEDDPRWHSARQSLANISTSTSIKQSG